jgi:hypothetical protein
MPTTSHPHRHPGPGHPRKGLHKDWRTWLALALMLAAVAIYVLTLDDSLLSLAAAHASC